LRCPADKESSEEPAEKLGGAVSRHCGERRGMSGIGLMALYIGEPDVSLNLASPLYFLTYVVTWAIM
jgi:hypothetical protein